MADTVIALVSGTTVTTELGVEEAADLVAAAAQRQVLVLLTSARSGRKVAINPEHVVSIRSQAEERQQ